MAEEVKTFQEHMETGVKYATPSVGGAYATARILTFFYPDLEAIQLEIAAVLTVLGNLLLITIFKSTDGAFRTK